MSVGIYKITSPSGKVYIGQSWRIERRFVEYRYDYLSKSQKKLNRSFNKYGTGNHVFDVIVNFDESVTQDELDKSEQHFMDEYRSMGYELLNIREAGSRGKHSEETIKKMKANVGKWMLGRKLSKETKEKIGKASKGNKYAQGKSPSLENRIKTSLRFKGSVGGFNGKKHTDDAKKKISERLIGNKYSLGVKWTESQRELMMKSRSNPWNKGKKGLVKHSDDTKLKMSKSHSGMNHHMVRITDDEVAQMRELFNNGIKIKVLAEKYKISTSHCTKIVNNKIRKICVH